tara:strand:+ start:1845 stop:2141 length:297 start_codon:yes stop_codon:yes gene_type:complete
MPLIKCADRGWKFGEKGKCYTGPDAKNKARKQGVAIKITEECHGNELEKELQNVFASMSNDDMWNLVTEYNPGANKLELGIAYHIGLIMRKEINGQDS